MRLSSKLENNDNRHMQSQYYRNRNIKKNCLRKSIILYVFYNLKEWASEHCLYLKTIYWHYPSWFCEKSKVEWIDRQCTKQFNNSSTYSEKQYILLIWVQILKSFFIWCNPKSNLKKSLIHNRVNEIYSLVSESWMQVIT